MYLLFLSYCTNHIIKLGLPIEIPSKEANAEIEIHPLTTEAKIRMCSIF